MNPLIHAFMILHYLQCQCATATLRAFFVAKLCMTLLKSTFRAISHSILKSARLFNRSWVIVLRKKLFFKLSLLNDRSADATVTGSVQTILREVQTLANISSSLKEEILFRRFTGVTGLESSDVACTHFSCSISSVSHAGETSLWYSTEKVVHAS